MIKPGPRLLSILYLIIIPFFCFCQHSKQWEFYLPSGYTIQPSYNVNSSNHLKTVQLEDGTFVVLGSKKKASSDFGTEIFLFKYNTQGEVIWEYTYEHSKGLSEYPNDITIDLDGNILITGKVTTYFNNDYEGVTETANFLLLKISPEADVLWEKHVETRDYFVNYGTTVIVDSAGDIYTLGKIVDNDENFVFLHKFDSDGNEIYTRKLNPYLPYDLKIIDDILYVVTRRYSTLSTLYRYDFSGNLLDSFSIDIGRNKPVFDQEGNIYSFHFTGDFELDKYDAEGNFQWTYQKDTNLPSNVYADELTDCIVDEEGNVYVTGRYYGAHYGDTTLYTNCDILTAKLDSDGNVIWENIYNYDNTRSCQIGHKVLLDNEGNTYVVGHQSVEKNGYIFASKDMVILKYNQNGERIDSIYHNAPSDRDDIGINFFIQDDTLYVVGYSDNEDLSVNYNVIKYSPKTKVGTTENERLKGLVYPNPNDGKFYVKCNSRLTDVRIVDKLGRTIFIKDILECDSPINVFNRPPGIYFMTYFLDNKRHAESIIIGEN